MHDSPRALREPLNPERNELTSLVHRHDSPRLGDGAGGTFPESVVANVGEPAPEHTPVFTYLCILANVAMMVVSIWKNGWKFESFSDNPMYGPSSATLLSLGAKQADLIRVGQWWRLFAPQYLHAGLIHLAMNMNGLWNLGRGLEGEIGFLRIALLYTASGVSGIVASSIFVPHVVGVGASGALYGLIGCLFADFAHNHKLIENKWSYFIKLVLSTAFGIALGLLPLVDNFAHVFGMIAGLFIGSILLVPKCGDCGYQARRLKQYTCYGECFAVVGAVLLIGWFSFGFFFLYTARDAYEWCTFCKYLSCLPTPWWTCPSNVPLCQFTNGTSSYIGPCPPGPLP